jgi:hypothetical protein
MRTDRRPKELFPPGAPPDYVLAAQQMAREAVAGLDQERPLRAASKQVSVPLPLGLLAKVEVLAQRLGQSRGGMVAQLSRLGAEVVLDQLPADSVDEVWEEIKDRYDELFSEYSPDQEG